MKHLRRFFLKFICFLPTPKRKRNWQEKLRAHLALLEDEYLRQGMPPEDARRAARLAYGGVEQAKQLHRDERAFQGLDADSARYLDIPSANCVSLPDLQ